MIQRIQSIYLLLVTILSSFLTGKFISFADKEHSLINLSFSGLSKVNKGITQLLGESVLPWTIIIILVIVLSLITIFLFRNRALQMTSSKILIFLTIAMLCVAGYYAITISTKFDASLIPGVKMAIPLLNLVFSFLALKSIKNDDNLVKSYDRLR